MPLLLVKLANLFASQRAQTLAEYGLLLSLVAVGVVIPTVIIFRVALIDAINSATTCLQNLPGSCGNP